MSHQLVHIGKMGLRKGSRQVSGSRSALLARSSRTSTVCAVRLCRGWRGRRQVAAFWVRHHIWSLGVVEGDDGLTASTPPRCIGGVWLKL
jgi:hypothetical protein